MPSLKPQTVAPTRPKRNMIKRSRLPTTIRSSSKSSCTQDTTISSHVNPHAKHPSTHAQPLSPFPPIFSFLRHLTHYMQYSQQCYHLCLQLLRKYQLSKPSKRIQAQYLTLTLFSLYSKMYEFRQVPLDLLIKVANYQKTKEEFIEIEAYVLEKLGFDLNVEEEPTCSAQVMEYVIAREKGRCWV